MGAVLSSISARLLFGLLLVGLYLGYRAISPKPLPGIPYNRDAAKKLFGDIPEVMRYVMRKKQIFCWLTSLTTKHQSPIVQAFFKPGEWPWVVVTDPYESQDILLRRTKEFDRTLFKEMIGGILPEQHSHYPSTDVHFKHNRNLINHLMAPTFISQVSAREVYNSVCTLIKVWQAKCDLAKGRPFSAHHDITYAALDAIFASSFGLPEQESNTIQRLNAVLEHAPQLNMPKDLNEPVEFPEGTIPTIFAAVLTIQDSATITQMSPAPIFASWILRKLPKMKKAIVTKDQYIRDKVANSVELIEKAKTTAQEQQQPTSALHSVLQREREVAEKEGRQPDYFKRAIADEFFGFTMAGHDTTATATAWGVKYLTDHPAAQDTLRTALRRALPDALAQQRSPTYQELIKAHVPYLDAVVEEITRHANTIAFVARRAMQDTTVLGQRIPKGTDVLLMANGPGYLEPNMRIDEDKSGGDAENAVMRSPGARLDGGKSLTSLWDDEDIRAFKPERWLKRDPESGTERFDPMAGPNLAFGAGLRGCFGKKLALQALKLQFALFVWNFKLLKTLTELNSYDAVQKFAREPTQCYLRLERADL
ncbi:hypothetical protein PG997_000807 [Apiospora hydei]|uniref:Cytochrome P450 n=1 Tax=Apiospora hydei TaxID=1337664 RepID=A0ABR1XBS3_9PEZI